MSSAASEEDMEPSIKGSDSEPDISNEDDVEEEEEEPEEEEELQEENDDEEKSADSSDSVPSEATNDDPNDSSQEIESEGNDEGRNSERIEENLASKFHDIEDGDGQCDSLNCSSEPLATPIKDQPHVIDGDSKHQISGKGVIFSEGNLFSESLVDDKGIGAWPETKAPIEACVNVTKGHSGNQAHLNKSDSIGADNCQSSSFAEKEVAAETQMTENSDCNVSNRVLYSHGETKQMDVPSGEDVKLRASSLIPLKLRPRSLSPGAEIEDRNKRPAIICDFFARGWCIKGSACRFLHQKDAVDTKGHGAVSSSKAELVEDSGLRQEAEKNIISSLSEPLTSSISNYPSSKSIFPSSEMQLKSSIGEEYNRSFGIPLLHENQNHYSELMDSKRSTGEEFVRGYPLSRNSLVPESRFVSSGSVISSSIYGNNNNSFALENQSTIHDAHTLPRFSGSLNSSFNASLPSTDISPMRRDWGFYTSRSSSLPRRSSSPFYSRSEQENLSQHRVPSDLVVSTGHITQSTANNWEPSVPFRPSFDISSILSSPRSQYDPLLDSIEPTYGGVRSHQSSFGQGSTIQNFSHNQTNVNLISCYQQPQGGSSDNHTAEAEPTLTSVANQQNTSSMSKEEKPGLDDNLRHPTDEAKHNKESKSLKVFRGSLVEFVKELLKPSWREGHLSKDAHNMIVKKAVDKVLSALQPHQIPSTTESINQYLSLSQPKLAKLVEGYVGKYGKS